MTAVPLHIKRRFEQRWASRFTASSSPQTKSPATTESNFGAGRKGPKKDGRCAEGPERFTVLAVRQACRKPTDTSQDGPGCFSPAPGPLVRWN
jgi:hypothetical protein